MRSGLLLMMMLGVGAVAGCAGSPPPEPIDPSSDPAWLPPGQGDLTVADARVVEKPKRSPRARHLDEPNHREIQRGALHAKTDSAGRGTP